jgi:hypothetical protein
MRAVKRVVVYPVGSYARISYPSRSTICKDHLPWVSLQLQEIRIPYIPYFDGFFENKSYIRRAHRAAEDTWACYCSARQPL